MRLCKKLYNKDFVNNTLKKAQRCPNTVVQLPYIRNTLFTLKFLIEKHNYSVIIMNDVPVNCYQAAKLFLN